MLAICVSPVGFYHAKWSDVCFPHCAYDLRDYRTRCTIIRKWLSFWNLQEVLKMREVLAVSAQVLWEADMVLGLRMEGLYYYHFVIRGDEHIREALHLWATLPEFRKKSLRSQTNLSSLQSLPSPAAEQGTPYSCPVIRMCIGVILSCTPGIRGENCRQKCSVWILPPCLRQQLSFPNRVWGTLSSVADNAFSCTQVLLFEAKVGEKLL